MIFHRQDKEREQMRLFDRNAVKVIVTGCIVLAAALMIMSITGIMIMNKAAVDKLKQDELQMQAENISTMIESRIDKASSTAQMLAHSPLIVEWLRQPDAAGGQFPVVPYVQYLADSMDYDTVFFAAKNTDQYWAYHDRRFTELEPLSAADPQDQWFFSFLQRQVPYEMKIDYNKSLKDTFVWINALVEADGRPVGAAGVGMNLGKVVQSLLAGDREAGRRNDLWLVDGEGRICLSKDPAYLDGLVQQYFPPSLAEDIQQAPEQAFFVQEYENENGRLYDIAYKRIQNSDWKVVIRTSRADSLAFLDKVKYHMAASGAVILLCMGLLFFLVSRRIADPYKRALQLNQELEEAVTARTTELQEKNMKIQDSLEYARLIQQAIMPSTNGLAQYLKDAFVIFEPKESIGGDFYWYRAYETGVLLSVGDCTGHGVPGALMTTAINAMLNHIADETGYEDPAKVLQQLAAAFCQSFSGNGGKSITDGFEAAVVFVGRNGQVAFAGANMSLYYYDGSQMVEIRGDRGAVDCQMAPEKKDFSKKVIVGQMENMFYAVTDGYRQQPGGERSLPYGKKRLLALLKSVAGRSGVEQKEQILQELHAYAPMENRRDDVTVLGFRI